MNENNTILPASHTIIDATALGKELCKYYPLPNSTSCELLHRGMNDFYLLRTIDKLYVAQVWRVNTRDFDQVLYEMEFLVYLNSGGINVPIPYKTNELNLAIEVLGPDGPRYVAIFNYIEGKVFSSNPNSIISKKMGKIFGDIHNLSEKFESKVQGKVIDRAKSINDLMPYVEKVVSHRSDDLSFYKEVASLLIYSYNTSKSNKNIKSGTTHGDFHIHNAFVNNDCVTIMDFDACGIDYFVQELMSYKWSIEKNDLPFNLWEDFFSSYLSVRNLSSSEIKSIPIFLLGKEFSYLCGFSYAVDAIGHVAFHFPGLDWFSKSIQGHAKEAFKI
ncbi:phosphotransferase [Alphaproteobacteria bacterium]|nr:phosphotransferase [Alphaproteobacteria bacterium]